MPLDLTSAPPGVTEYAETLRGKTNAELFADVRAVEETAFVGGADIQNGEEHWKLRCDLAELERRLAGWLGTDGLPKYEKVRPCPKCGFTGANGEAAASTKFCPGDVNDNRKVCHGREAEHLHRKCGNCSYEWLEACAGPAG